MAKSRFVKFTRERSFAVAEFLTWLHAEIEQELEELPKVDVRLLGIKDELEKFLKEYLALQGS